MTSTVWVEPGAVRARGRGRGGARAASQRSPDLAELYSWPPPMVRRRRLRARRTDEAAPPRFGAMI
ncbi:MAG TPA: hypothetical protein VFW03_01190 [Gemmatimonadaceae bacterium]|nr:hypothetical protein [Gemmatimonadaceae bacterium]